jgi:putative ABC transport system substrate-binding protein
MNRRTFLLLAAPLASLARAQPASRTYRIGYLGSAPVDSLAAPVDGLMAVFLGRLQELGYTAGKNLIVDRRTTEGLNERYLTLATELVNLKVDVILAPGTAAALAAKKATSTVPIVTVVVGDPVGSHLIASFARPGGNITGTSSAGGEVTPKQLELLKEILPRVSRVVVLSNQTTPLHVTLLKELEGAARPLQVALHPVDVRSPQDLENAFRTIAKVRPDAVIPLDDPLMFQERRRIAEFALQNRLPTASFQRFFTEAGTLLSYGPSFADLFLRAATYVDKIFKGAKPADLPVERPTQVRACHQSEDRQGARPYHSAIAVAARGRGDSVAERIELIAVECPVLVWRNGRSGQDDGVSEPVVHDASLRCRFDITTLIVFSRTSVGLNSTISVPA